MQKTDLFTALIISSLLLCGCTGISEADHQTITLPPDQSSNSVNTSDSDISSAENDLPETDIAPAKTKITDPPITVSSAASAETLPSTLLSVPETEKYTDTADTADTFPDNFSVITMFPLPTQADTVRDVNISAETVPTESEGSVFSPAPQESYYPPVNYNTLNYNIQHAVWISYLEYESVMRNRTEEEFTDSIRTMFGNLLEIGVNTVYFQVRAFGDAYYRSDFFPKGDRLTGNYDPLETAVKAAHDCGLSIHAWINPMRLMTDEQMKALPENNILSVMYRDNDKGYMFESGGRWYLDPSNPDSVDLICAGISELLSRYKTDGIQIDDYFYPDTDSSLGYAAYISSGTSLSQADWRRETVDNMVLKMNSAVHNTNPSAVFGISPSGNTEVNYSELYADTVKWCGDTSYCDYICPQLYYGFEHETSPFVRTAEEWMTFCSDSGVKLVIGLAAYKTGTRDNWAGSGADEWRGNDNIILKQIEFCAANSLGTALFRYDSLFNSPETADELEDIKEYYKE